MPLPQVSGGDAPDARRSRRSALSASVRAAESARRARRYGAAMCLRASATPRPHTAASSASVESVKECAAGRARAADVGGAKPVRPALQPEIRDQRQARNVRGLGDLLDARQRRRCDREQRIVHQKMRRESRPRSRPVTNAEVRPGVVEARQRDRGLEIQVHVGMRGDERRQSRDQPAVRERMQRRDANARDFLITAQQRAGNCVEICQCRVGGIRERPPLRSERLRRARDAETMSRPASFPAAARDD